MKQRRRLPTAPTALLLIPLLDMVSLLVQVLLINIHFGVFAELPAKEVVAVGSASSQALALTIDVVGSGFTVRWNEPVGSRSQDLPCTAPCVGVDQFPFSRLGALLGTLKDQHPGERGAVVRPLADLPFDIIARTMDTTRAADGRVLFPEIGLAGSP